jgi:hypothetical protein
VIENNENYFMNYHRLSDTYRFPGFKPKEHIKGVFGEPETRIVRLERTGKKLPAGLVGEQAGPSMTRKPGVYVISPVGIPGFTLNLKPEGSSARRAGM